MEVDPSFFVDFHGRPDGPVRAHETRLHGGHGGGEITLFGKGVQKFSLLELPIVTFPGREARLVERGERNRHYRAQDRNDPPEIRE